MGHPPLTRKRRTSNEENHLIVTNAYQSVRSTNSYLDRIMYISDNIEIDINNEYVLHEAIHRIQEYRNKKEIFKY